MNKKLIIPMLGMALLGGAGAGMVGFAHAQSADSSAANSLICQFPITVR
jgi:hypothetical protein